MQKQSQVLSSEQREGPKGLDLEHTVAGSPASLTPMVKEVWRGVADTAQGQAQQQRQGSHVILGPKAWRASRSYQIPLNHNI